MTARPVTADRSAPARPAALQAPSARGPERLQPVPELIPDGPFVEVAVLGKTWGLRGDITVRLHNLDSEMEWTRDAVWLEGPGVPSYAVAVDDWQAKGAKVLVRLIGIQTPEDAQALVGCKVKVPATWLGEAEEGELFVKDLLGMEVIDDVRGSLGRIVDVFDSGAIDVWVVQGEGGETLLPAIKQFVHSVDRGARLVCCHYEEV